MAEVLKISGKELPLNPEPFTVLPVFLKGLRPYRPREVWRVQEPIILQARVRV